MERAIIRKLKPRLVFNLVLAGMVGLCVVFYTIGIMTKETRLILAATPVMGVVTLLVNAPYALRRRPGISRVSLVVLVVLVASPVVLMHDGPPNADTLRLAYASRLESFEGAPYIWGGETHARIDCSGLARTALWEAMVCRGVAVRNPRLLGRMFWRFWWRDMSASDMLKGTYGYTRPIGRARELTDSSSVRMNDGLTLCKGDLAVPDNGSHVLIYVGNGKWIEANPGDGRVVTNKAEGSDRAYFNMPVTLLRWWVFPD